MRHIDFDDLGYQIHPNFSTILTRERFLRRDCVYGLKRDPKAYIQIYKRRNKKGLGPNKDLWFYDCKIIFNNLDLVEVLGEKFDKTI